MRAARPSSPLPYQFGHTAVAAVQRHAKTLVAGLLLAALPLADGLAADAARDVVRGQDVTIIAGEERTIYEYRQNGVLRAIRIVPKLGRPYYLVPADETRGFGDLERAGRLVPRWTLIEF